MQDTVLVGTEDGLLVFRVEGTVAKLELHTFLSRYVTALAAAEDAVLAASLRYGVGRVDPLDWSTDWTLDAHVLSLATHPASRNVCLAGAEPAALFRSDDGGRRWRELPALRHAPEAARWYHPSPASAPHVLGLAWDPDDLDTFYAGIEVGGVFKTRDGGQSFLQMNEGLYEDIHKLAGHPRKPRELWAVTGGGLYKSEDGAESWRPASRGMSRRYASALGVVTGPVEALVASAAQGPPWNGAYNANAVIFRSTSGGNDWEAGMQGLPQSLDGVPVAFVPSTAAPGRVYAGVASGEFMASDNAGRSWHLLAADLPSIQTVLCLPPGFPEVSSDDTGASAEVIGPESALGAQRVP